MPLQRGTRLILGLALGAPVAFLIAYPWICMMLPIQVQEWADLPRDLMGFVAADAAVAVVCYAIMRGRGR